MDEGMRRFLTGSSGPANFVPLWKPPSRVPHSDL